MGRAAPVLVPDDLDLELYLDFLATGEEVRSAEEAAEAAADEAKADVAAASSMASRFRSSSR